MFELPTASIENDARIGADWVELCCLAGDGAVSRAELEEALHDAGLFGVEPRDRFAGEAVDDESIITVRDCVGRYGETVWQLLGSRARDMAAAYPFEVDDNLIVRRPKSWTDAAAYLTLLIADIGRSYETVRVEFEPQHSGRGGFPHLFEKIVEASQRGLLGGSTVRFGLPIESDWPTAIVDRIEKLAEQIGGRIGTLDEATEATDGDLGLDIATRWSIAGEYEATFVLLTQCATGQNWRSKQGEPSLEMWRTLVDWKAKLLKGIAVPWRIADHYRRYLFFEAVVLDRPRLCAGSPDTHLSDAIRQLLVSWCQERVSELPRLNA